MHIKKHLNFKSLRQAVSDLVSHFEDKRQNGKVEHSLHDSCLSALAMMIFQDPSMLAFQTRLQNATSMNNLKTIFDVQSIPKASQMKDVLDSICHESFYPIFTEFLSRLQRAKELEKFKYINDSYLIALDGTQYFSSENIGCHHCLTKKLKSGNILFYHQAIAATIVHPDHRHVIPLAPELITNNDGSKKQDCERNAGKRIVQRIRKTHPKLPIIVLGDDLYSNHPFIQKVKQDRMSFIFVAKPTSHKFMFECLNDLNYLGDIQTFQYTDSKDRTHIYKWYNSIPLTRTQPENDYVNFFEYSIVSNGKTTFHYSWVTDITVTIDNVEKLVKAGRARWKIENEAFNTLKNQGYHADHNFGHGDCNLSFNFFILNLIAFFMHQISEMTDRYYQQCRNAFTSKKEFWNNIRTAVRLLIFSSWEKMLVYVTDPPSACAWQPP